MSGKQGEWGVAGGGAGLGVPWVDAGTLQRMEPSHPRGLISLEEEEEEEEETWPDSTPNVRLLP